MLFRSRNKIDEDYKKAIKNKEQVKTNTLRLVKSGIKDKDILSRTNDNKDGISDQEILSLLISLIKQRKDSIQQYKDGGRPDLEEIEQKELDLLATYLPQALSGDALKTVISEIISENGFSGMQDMGNVMKELKIKHSNAEMSEASSFVKELLS